MKRGVFVLLILGLFLIVISSVNVVALEPQGIIMKNVRFIDGSCSSINQFVSGNHWTALNIQGIKEYQGVQNSGGWQGSTILENGLSGPMVIYLVKPISSSLTVDTPFSSDIKLTNSDVSYNGIITGYIITDEFQNHQIKGSITLFDETTKLKSFTGNIEVTINKNLNSCAITIYGVEYNSQLITSVQGPRGDTGATGPQGPQGIPGINTSVDLTSINSNISNFNQRISLLESWKNTIIDTVDNILLTLTNHDSRIDALESSSGENSSGNGTTPDYFKYLSSGDRKNIVCGYAEDNHLSNYTDLGWNCDVNYRTNSRGIESSSCRCKKI
ncbi:MAG: collagen-like protein [Nanoarchaeota archaeon]|nr:collagen-like protein [Nanoarchaeota archaeon]